MVPMHDGEMARSPEQCVRFLQARLARDPMQCATKYTRANAAVGSRAISKEALTITGVELGPIGVAALSRWQIIANRLRANSPLRGFGRDGLAEPAHQFGRDAPPRDHALVHLELPDCLHCLLSQTAIALT